MGILNLQYDSAHMDKVDMNKIHEWLEKYEKIYDWLETCKTNDSNEDQHHKNFIFSQSIFHMHLI